MANEHCYDWKALEQPVSQSFDFKKLKITKIIKIKTTKIKFMR